ncbi:MAG: class E sortase [Actinobacteria bacterium]|nr:class E sortase [Actinomycetota bacterium]
MLHRVLGGVGRSMMTAGTLILLFVAYQLWGTGLQEAKAQRELRQEFSAMLEQVDATSTTTTTAAPDTTEPPEVVTAPADLPLPAEGDPVAEIRIPRIGITRTIVEGIGLDQLKRGVGHYPTSPLPGQAGNVAIAGHRTTYGQPFHNIDKLEPGDEITFRTLQGEYRYEVIGTEIVADDAIEVLEDKGDNRVTLIACHPKYSLAQRIVVSAELKGSPAPPIEGQDEVRAAADATDPFASVDGGLSGEPAARWPTIWWGLACAAVWLATWLVQTLLRRRLRSREERPTRAQRLVTWTPYLVGVPVFLVTLYVFFENFGRLLPGNY